MLTMFTIVIYKIMVKYDKFNYQQFSLHINRIITDYMIVTHIKQRLDNTKQRIDYLAVIKLQLK